MFSLERSQPHDRLLEQPSAINVRQTLRRTEWRSLVKRLPRTLAECIDEERTELICILTPRGCTHLLASPPRRSENVVSRIDEGDRPRPTRRRALDLDGKARHRKTIGGQSLEVLKLFQMAVTNLAPGLVSFPNQAGVTAP
jgi:hypothetical protein